VIAQVKKSIAWIGVIAAAVTTAVGCGDSPPFSVVPIRGKVTYADGRPIPAAKIMLYFNPQDVQPQGDKFPRPTEVVVAADGAFSHASTWANGDGCIPGKHKVVVHAFNADSGLNTTAVQARYREATTTPIQVTVKPKGENVFNFEVERGP
jgi:hypothetical protein